MPEELTTFPAMIPRDTGIAAAYHPNFPMLTEMVFVDRDTEPEETATQESEAASNLKNGTDDKAAASAGRGIVSVALTSRTVLSGAI
ncbi:MAG: hypothetical protein AABZ57_06365 [Candidatus Margulisiibacteriota bacterium]